MLYDMENPPADDYFEYPGAVQCVFEAHHGADPPCHREGLPPPLLHLRDVPP
uniref:LIM domain containing preferred translocation partner in lipoma n=1 Tax=Mus musculus TaxID=10090 RepID=A0A338P705_MOUSE